MELFKGFGFGNKNKAEVLPQNQERGNESPNLEFSAEVKKRLDEVASGLLSILDTIEDNWKSLSATGTAMTFAALFNVAQAQSPDASPEKIQVLMAKFEAAQKVSPAEVLKYEDQLAQYAAKYGEGFTVDRSSDGITYGRKIKFGDNVGVRFYYKDSLAENPEGFALNYRRDAAGRTRDMIMVDGKVALKDVGVESQQGTVRDGKVDRVIGKVDGVVASSYDYVYETDPATKKQTVSVEGTRMNPSGAKSFKLASAEQNFVDAEEYLRLVSGEAAKRAATEEATASTDISTATL